jgi:hypothetical protein
MNDTDPLVSVLAGLVVDLVWWLDSCGDDEVDPDSAVKMMESVAGVLDRLPDDQRERLLKTIEQMAAAEEHAGRRQQLRNFPYACGLVEDEPLAP